MAGGCWWGEGRRGESGWAGFTCREKFSVPSGVQVLDLNQRPSGCHSSRPRAFMRLAQSRSAQGRFRGSGVPARAASGSAGNRGVPKPGLLLLLLLLLSPPLHHSSPPGNQQSAASGERWSNRKQSCFLTLLLWCLSGTERLRGWCLCSRVASVRDLLLSSQRLSNQYLISPSFSATTKEKGPSTTQDSLS